MRLRKINLSKAKMSEHPDIVVEDKQYLVKWGGRFAAGYFTRQWYGLHFKPFWGQGFQFDEPGTNASTWEGIWEIIDNG